MSEKLVTSQEAFTSRQNSEGHTEITSTGSPIERVLHTLGVQATRIVISKDPNLLNTTYYRMDDSAISTSLSWRRIKFDDQNRILNVDGKSDIPDKATIIPIVFDNNLDFEIAAYVKDLKTFTKVKTILFNSKKFDDRWGEGSSADLIKMAADYSKSDHELFTQPSTPKIAA